MSKLRSGAGAPLLFVALVALAIGGVTASANADANADEEEDDDDKAETPSAEMVKKMSVFVTPGGSYLALLPQSGKDQVYFGDSRNLYRQRVLISAVDEDDNLSVLIWAPEHPRDAAVESHDDKWFLRCGPKSVELSMVDADERSLLLRAAKFREARFQRAPYVLARNQHGEYFYVDRRSQSLGTRGFRLFVGRAGRIKEQKLKWVVSDSEGDVFASRAGELRITTDDKGQQTLRWQRKKQIDTLLAVPIGQNSYLIYKELGVYQNQSFGTPCDSH